LRNGGGPLGPRPPDLERVEAHGAAVAPRLVEAEVSAHRDVRMIGAEPAAAADGEPEPVAPGALRGAGAGAEVTDPGEGHIAETELETPAIGVVAAGRRARRDVVRVQRPAEREELFEAGGESGREQRRPCARHLHDPAGCDAVAVMARTRRVEQ